MTIRGHVENGVVVPDEKGALPEGAEVEIVICEAREQPASVEPTETDDLGEFFRNWAGSLDDLPPDFAAQHDHYIRGTPKRPAESSE